MCFPAQKEKTSVGRRIEVTGLDRGKSYCFNVQVYIPTRKINKQLGELSQVQCFPAEDRPFYDGKILTELQYVPLNVFGGS